jgi:hypothetical protein
MLQTNETKARSQNQQAPGRFHIFCTSYRGVSQTGLP